MSGDRVKVALPLPLVTIPAHGDGRFAGSNGKGLWQVSPRRPCRPFALWVDRAAGLIIKSITIGVSLQMVGEVPLECFLADLDRVPDAWFRRVKPIPYVELVAAGATPLMPHMELRFDTLTPGKFFTLEVRNPTGEDRRPRILLLCDELVEP
jgi:hypothetical protein